MLDEEKYIDETEIEDDCEDMDDDTNQNEVRFSKCST